MTQKHTTIQASLLALCVSTIGLPALADWADDARARMDAARARMKADPQMQALRDRTRAAHSRTSNGGSLFDAKTKAQHAALRKEMDSNPQFQAFERRAAVHHQEYQQKQDAQVAARVAAAAKVTQSPSQCIRSFESALYAAKNMDQLMPYFSENYKTRYTMGDTAQTKFEHLKRLKTTYAYPLNDEKQAEIHDHIEKGEATVHLEGKNLYDGKWKGVTAKFRMIPEGNYWKIDGMETTTGLTILEIPSSTSIFGTSH